MIAVPRLAFYRHKMLLSQKELAAKAGVSAGTIIRLEAGNATAWDGTVRALAEALGVEVEELVKTVG